MSESLEPERNPVDHERPGLTSNRHALDVYRAIDTDTIVGVVHIKRAAVHEREGGVLRPRPAEDVRAVVDEALEDLRLMFYAKLKCAP